MTPTEILIPIHVLVIDVESAGLHGEAFSVGGVVAGLLPDGVAEYRSFHLRSDPGRSRGTAPDHAWVAANVPGADGEGTGFACREDMLDAFWELWLEARADYPDIVMCAECAWPVEARFLLECVDRRREDRNWEGPYPLHDVASVMLAAGMDPMGTYERRGQENPAHDPLADARLSARLMWEALKKLTPGGADETPWNAKPEAWV